MTQMKAKIRDIKFYADKESPQTIEVSFSDAQGTMQICYHRKATLGICHHPEDAAKLIKILNKLSTKSKLSFFKK